MEMPQPNSALRRLDKLVGIWKITGRTLDSKIDNIEGLVTIEWTLDDYFLQQKGKMEIMDTKMQSLEILGYDPSTDTFPALVYSNMGSIPLSYNWDVQGNIVTHWTIGAKYTGTFSEDGNVLKGGWRADGAEENAGNTYDAIMIKIK
jgi:hypothetical protein